MDFPPWFEFPSFCPKIRIRETFYFESLCKLNKIFSHLGFELERVYLFTDLMCYYVIFIAYLVQNVVYGSGDPHYENNMASWQCKLPYGTNRLHISSSFAHCFKDPSKYCRQHSVSMNACKHHTNMGLYCCSMQTINYKIARDAKLPSWMTKERFLEITSDHGRPSQMFLFFAFDIKIGKIESAEEMAVFLSLV